VSETNAKPVREILEPKFMEIVDRLVSKLVSTDAERCGDPASVGLHQGLIMPKVEPTVFQNMYSMFLNAQIHTHEPAEELFRVLNFWPPDTGGRR
jgi:hypothetical protein